MAFACLPGARLNSKARTTETSPEQAVESYLAGTLPLGEPEAHSKHDHHDEH